MLVEILLVIVVIIAALVLFGPRLFMQLIKRQFRAEEKRARNMAPAESDPLLEGLNPSVPALLYFTADWCGPCRTTQAPIVERLSEQFGDTLQVRKIDIGANPDAARRWGVQTLPRTVVLGSGFFIHATNLGVASQATLTEQIEGARNADADGEMIITREEIGDLSNAKFRRRDPAEAPSL